MEAMRVFAKGAYRMNGVAKTSGKPYDMGKLVIEVPIENVKMPNMNREGFGFTSLELDVEPEAIKNFAFPFPCYLDIEVAQKLQFGKIQSLIIGGKLVDLKKVV